MNPKLKATLYVLGCVLGAFAIFGLIALCVMFEWIAITFAIIFALVILIFAWRRLYEIFKDES